MRPLPLPHLVGSFLVPWLLLACPARAEELPDEAASKRRYHLFRPTPAALLREMSTDRPDLTESPHTVDAGHVQVEVEAGRFARDEAGDQGSEEIGAMGVNLKLGLRSDVDLQLGCVGGARQSQDSGDSETTESGIGDTFVRLKWNLWGNDDGPTALALMPFVALPTGSDDLGGGAVRPGLIVPFGWAWPAGFDFGAMAQVDWAEDSSGEGRHAEWLTTATVGHGLAGSLGAFAEFAATTRPPDEGAWVGTVDLGLVFAATPDIQLDGGAILGVSEAADGLGLFLGLSIRR